MLLLSDNKNSGMSTDHHKVIDETSLVSIRENKFTRQDSSQKFVSAVDTAWLYDEQVRKDLQVSNAKPQFGQTIAENVFIIADKNKGKHSDEETKDTVLPRVGSTIAGNMFILADRCSEVQSATQRAKPAPVIEVTRSLVKQSPFLSGPAQQDHILNKSPIEKITAIKNNPFILRDRASAPTVMEIFPPAKLPSKCVIKKTLAAEPTETLVHSALAYNEMSIEELCKIRQDLASQLCAFVDRKMTQM